MKAIQHAASLLDPSSSSGALRSLKLNVVVLSTSNADEVLPFLELTKDLPISIRFIEYMPFDGNKWSTQKLVPSSVLLGQILDHHGKEQVVPLKPGLSETSREYRIDGHRGSFGFISSMTDHFCSGCSRLRIGADGGMKVSSAAQAANSQI